MTCFCGASVLARGMCRNHYMQWYKNRDYERVSIPTWPWLSSGPLQATKRWETVHAQSWVQAGGESRLVAMCDSAIPLITGRHAPESGSRPCQKCLRILRSTGLVA